MSIMIQKTKLFARYATLTYALFLPASLHAITIASDAESYKNTFGPDYIEQLLAVDGDFSGNPLSQSFGDFTVTTGGRLYFSYFEQLGVSIMDFSQEAVFRFERPITSFGMWVGDLAIDGTFSLSFGDQFESAEILAPSGDDVDLTFFAYIESETPFQTVGMRNTFMSSRGGGVFYNFAVPEPSTALFLILGASCFLARRRAR